MEKITKQIISDTAKKLKFEIEDDEVEILLKQFNLLLKQAETFESVLKVDDVEPMVFPFDVTNSYLREDEATDPIDRDELLKNAKEVKDGQISIPRVVKK